MTDTTNSLSAGLASPDAATLHAAHLSRSFDARLAVDDASFQVVPGETYRVLGSNGAGKTTTIRRSCADA